MIAGPGAITTTIVLTNEAMGMSTLAWLVIFASIGIAIGITYFMMRHADYIISKVGQRQYRVINRLLGMLLMAIAVQFVITGIKIAFPLTGGS
jgi:multiple antibiotic resistance protein